MCAANRKSPGVVRMKTAFRSTFEPNKLALNGPLPLPAGQKQLKVKAGGSPAATFLHPREFQAFVLPAHHSAGRRRTRDAERGERWVDV